MRILIFSMLLFISNTGFQAQELIQNNNTTAVTFKIKNIGMYVNGNFNEVAVTSNFNTKNLGESYINAIIKVNSISTKSLKRDKHLLQDDFFDAAKYETIKLVSTNIGKISENSYQLKAKLTIKKITKSVVIPLDISETENSITIKSNFKLNRRDYNVGGSSWVLSNTVNIQIVYVAKK